MRVIECLACDPPAELILEEAGTFTYCDAEGEETTAKFFVRCPAKPERDTYNPTIDADRQDAANEQLTDMWRKLKTDGCLEIHFKNKMPDPFF